jgi:hypothetical protein
MPTDLTESAVDELVARAQYVFRCVVLELNASNLGSVPLEPQMGVVGVEEVVLAPPSLGDLTGRQLTVYFASTDGVRKGQRLNLAASSWHYGKEIGVVEEARFAEDVGQVREEFLAARLRLNERFLEARVERAELIVGGHVLSTQRTERDDSGGEGDEPEWWEADVRVETVHKGRPPAEHVSVWFPIGGEREWDEAPKFFPGQEGVWLLSHGPIGEHRDVAPKRKRVSREARQREPFTALDPLDFHSVADRDRIDALVLRTSGGTRGLKR